MATQTESNEHRSAPQLNPLPSRRSVLGALLALTSSTLAALWLPRRRRRTNDVDQPIIWIGHR